MEDEGQFAILVLTVIAALASLAIFAELGSGAGAGRRPAHIGLGSLHDLLSWAFSTRSSRCTTRTSSTTRPSAAAWLPGRRDGADYWDFATSRSSSDDLAGVRRGRHQQADSPHRRRPRRRVVRLQRRAPRVDVNIAASAI